MAHRGITLPPLATGQFNGWRFFLLAVTSDWLPSSEVKTSFLFFSGILVSVAISSCKPKQTGTTPEQTKEPVAATPPTPPSPKPATPEAPAEPAPPTTPESVDKLEVGNRVSVDALTAATWIQGDAPTEFEQGKVYILECWATWCGPCIRAIPHMNELHVKYHEKGLRIYGMNVMEDGIEKVKAFVEKKGDGMKYPVAYTGKGSEFAKQWLKPAGVRGIPHAFVVIDGTLKLMCHPARLDDQLIEKLLQGGDAANKALAEINSSRDSQNPRQGVMSDFQRAVAKGDIATMESIYSKLEKEQPGSPFIGMMKIDINLAKKDWSALDSLLVENPQTPSERSAAGLIASRLALGSQTTQEAPAELLQKTARTFSDQLNQRSRSNPMEWLCLSSLQFRTSDKSAARTSAAKASELAASAPKGAGMPPEIFQRFQQSIEADALPTSEELGKWIQEALRKKSPGKAPTNEN